MLKIQYIEDEVVEVRILSGHGTDIFREYIDVIED